MTLNTPDINEKRKKTIIQKYGKDYYKTRKNNLETMPCGNPLCTNLLKKTARRKFDVCTSCYQERYRKGRDINDSSLEIKAFSETKEYLNTLFGEIEDIVRSGNKLKINVKSDKCVQFVIDVTDAVTQNDGRYVGKVLRDELVDKHVISIAKLLLKEQNL